MYEVAICDDSALDRRLLREDIGRYKKYQEQIRFHEYGSGRELLSKMEQIRFSIIFLDIQMGGMDGEKTAEEIRKLDDSVVLVFYTGCAEPTPHSFEVQPYRFIKKNMSQNEKNRNIIDALDKMAAVIQMPLLEAKINGGRLFLKPDDIVYIEKYRKSVKVYLSQSAKRWYHIRTIDDREPEIRIADKLGNLYSILRQYGYGYPHDSYIINYKYLMSCIENEIRLEGFPDTVFKVSRSKAVEFNQMKKEFLTAKYGDR